MNSDPSAQADDLDPSIRQFQREIAAAYGHRGDFAGLPLAERRRIGERVRAPWRTGGPAMRLTEEQRVGDHDVRIRIHRPTDAPLLPALIYLHGGGWTMFSLDTHDRLMREYAARTGVAVIGIDYSLSPEARFPTAIEETLSVIRWLRAEGWRHGVDPSRIAIGGDSAGANLAVAANLGLRAAGEAPLSAMLLNYGAFDSNPEGHDSYRRFNGDSYNLTAEEMAGFWQGYVSEQVDLENPLASPIRAELEGLPPAFLAVAECDILADENVAFAKVLRAAGVAVNLNIYAGATHSFLEAVSISPLADRALDEAAAWLRGRLAPPSVLLVGAGRMGEAFVRGWGGIADVSFLDPGVEVLPGARKLASLDEAAGISRPLVVMIAVKPQVLGGTLPTLAALAAPDVLFVSIAAGVELATFRAILGDGARVIRAMPNTPVSVGAGITAAVCMLEVSEAQRESAGRLLSAVGEIIWLKDEAHLDAVTAVSGSGPAYFFRFSEALSAAGAEAGLEIATAKRLARATLSGSGAVAAVRAEDLDALRAEVTSPGGTTAAALDALEGAGVDRIVATAVAAAVARARVLAAATEPPRTARLIEGAGRVISE